MTYNQSNNAAEFGKEVFSGNTITLTALKGKTIDNVEVANNLDYKGEPRCGLWVHIGAVKLGLFRWDLNNIVITEYPEKNKPVFKTMTDVLHEAAKEAFGKPEKEWLEAIATKIKGMKADCYLYPAQTQKGASYQAAIFTVSK